MPTESAEAFIARKNAAWADDRARRIDTKDIGRQGRNVWVREAWTFRIQHNYPEKVLVIERLRHVESIGLKGHEGGAQPGDIEYRLGYFVVGRIGRRQQVDLGSIQPVDPAGRLRGDHHGGSAGRNDQLSVVGV